MRTLRRDAERHHACLRRQDTWSTFFSLDPATTPVAGFGNLELFEESSLPPGASLAPGPRHDVEIVTYVHHGALANEDSTGGSDVVRTGEFQRMTYNRRIRHGERNASQTAGAHVFQMSLHPSVADLDLASEQKYFSETERRGVLRVVVSQDGRHGSLRICQDVLIHSAILDPGQHLIHALMRDRIAWLHVVYGEAAVGDLVLATGDSIGVTMEPAVSLTARIETEILLIDLAQ
jgi:hypothetical protein